MKSGLVEGKVCAGYINSGERMLAGGGCVVGGCTPAKPPWSEVMIFFGDFLRREAPNRRNLSAPMSGSLIGGQPCDGYISSGERMLAGGESVVGGRAPAKPPWSEVMIFLGDFLRREAPNRRNLSAPMSGSLIGGQPCAGYSAPASECWPEEKAWWVAVLRRSRGGRR